MADKQLAVAFLGTVVPENMCSNLPACSPAANKDALNLLKALKLTAPISLSTFSVQPVGVYPKSKRILIVPERRLLIPNVSCQLLPFINLLFIKQITIALAGFFYLVSWLQKNRHLARYIIVQNVYPPMSLPVVLATKLFGGKSVALVMDLPHNMSFDFQGVKGKLQRANLFVETRILRWFSGIVAYTRYIGEDHAPCVPQLVMEGGVDPLDTFTTDDNRAENGSDQRERIIFFSGSLSTTNGIELLLEAFNLLPSKSYRLWIFGRGRLGELVTQAARRDNRIRYFGFVEDQREVLHHQRQSTVLVSLRPKTDIVNRYTFPSKLREYMLSGRPVISTDAPSIPDEYHEHMIVLQDETPKGLAQLLEEVCARPSSELDRLGNQAHDFIIIHKDWAQQGRKVLDFIRNL